MESTITPKQIEEMKSFLRSHPIDPRYADLLDGDMPVEQATAQCYESILQLLGELPA